LRGLQSSILVVLCTPSANCAKRKLPANIEHNNVLNHKRNENVVAGVERMIFTVINKSGQVRM